MTIKPSRSIPPSSMIIPITSRFRDRTMSFWRHSQSENGWKSEDRRRPLQPAQIQVSLCQYLQNTSLDCTRRAESSQSREVRRNLISLFDQNFSNQLQFKPHVQNSLRLLRLKNLKRLKKSDINQARGAEIVFKNVVYKS